jgi:hypothetical protein
MSVSFSPDYSSVAGELTLDLCKFERFATALEAGYRQNAYHNPIHAADVVQNMFFFLKSKFLSSNLSRGNILACLLAAAMHDYGHPGVTNNFLVQTNAEIALRYNDRSVLENMHCAEVFLLLHRNPDLDIFKSFPHARRVKVRDTIIALVLATDMT